jgi:hypothetical protein
MAADLHIHVFPEGGLTEEDFANFFSHSLGSKWFNLGSRDYFDKEVEASRNKVMETENLWVGEVSWLKAALFGDEDTFVPGPVAQVNGIIGEDLPIIDDALIGRIREALRVANTTSYEVSREDEVVAFLELHKGKRAFTISW